MLQAILQQTFQILRVKPVKSICRIVLNSLFKTFEQVLVVNDVSVIFVITVKTIHSTNRLEQSVVAHLLIDIEVRGGRRVKTGEQLIHHNEQLHLARLLNKLFLSSLLVLFRTVNHRLGRIIEEISQHLFVDVELLNRQCFPLACIFTDKVANRWVVRCNNATFTLQRSLLEQVVIDARLGNA